jgi:hypothetical protein
MAVVEACVDSAAESVMVQQRFGFPNTSRAKSLCRTDSACSAVHPSKLLFDMQAFNAWLACFHWSFSPHCPNKIP